MHYQREAGVSAPNLVISATGDWSTEYALMLALRRGEIRALQLVWTEPHAIAGHSILATSARDDVAQLFDEEGHFRRNATEGLPSYALPGCSNSHIPGTYNRIARASIMAVEHTIAHLTGLHARASHRMCLSDSAVLHQLGGRPRPHAAMTGTEERNLTKLRLTRPKFVLRP